MVKTGLEKVQELDIQNNYEDNLYGIQKTRDYIRLKVQKNIEMSQVSRKTSNFNGLVRNELGLIMHGYIRNKDEYNIEKLLQENILPSESAFSLISQGYTSLVLKYLDRFEGISENEIAKKIILSPETGGIVTIIRNLNKFKKLNHDLVVLYALSFNNYGNRNNISKLFEKRVLPNFTISKELEYYLLGAEDKGVLSRYPELSIKMGLDDNLFKFFKKVSGDKKSQAILDRYVELKELSIFDDIMSFYIENKRSSLVKIMKKLSITKDVGLNRLFSS